MSNLFKALVAASALVALSGAAAADEQVSADFTFTPGTPVDVTYASFEKTAKVACRVEMRIAGGMSAKMKIEKACRDELMGNAVAATKMEALIAYHEGHTLPQNTIELASRD
jgi:hypothetical protein